jgi:hypothetical protein
VKNNMAEICIGILKKWIEIGVKDIMKMDFHKFENEA